LKFSRERGRSNLDECADQFDAGDNTSSREAAFEAALKAIEEHRHTED
jgi:hypothetical protein